MNKSVNLYVVVPCYNEEAVLSETSRQMLALFDEMKSDDLINEKSRIIFVDDGSKDKTWEIIDRLSDEHEEIGGIKLAHNAGHQNAVLGGLMTVMGNCDCAVSIDADLQDDIHVIPEMVRKFIDGCEIVYGVRGKRDTDTAFKRSTALGFYKIMKKLGADIIPNHADFRLMSQKALIEFSKFPERNLFLRGMVPLLGFKTDRVYYDRNERFAGESKYPLKKMISFALDGITSFSVKPISFITTLGIIVCVFAVVMGVYSVVQKFMGNTDAGWASLMMSIWFIGGVQLIALGLVGTYIGKIYSEVKRRPRFIIEEYKNDL